MNAVQFLIRRGFFFEIQMPFMAAMLSHFDRVFVSSVVGIRRKIILVYDRQHQITTTNVNQRVEDPI
jgi:hypothetical protein